MGEKEEVPLKPIKSREMPTVCGKESSLSLTGSDALSKAEGNMLIALDRDMLRTSTGAEGCLWSFSSLGDTNARSEVAMAMVAQFLRRVSDSAKRASFVLRPRVSPSRLALAFYIGNLAQPRKRDADKKGTVDPSQHCKSTNIQPPNPVKL